MRIAVISDIHGECFALDQVLQDMQRQGIEQMVCLGDALQGGSQPAETLARLRELSCSVVMGNADAWLITGQHYQIAVLPYSPLADGFLTGKYQRGQVQAVEGARVGSVRQRYDREEAWRVLAAVEQIAQESAARLPTSRSPGCSRSRW